MNLVTGFLISPRRLPLQDLTVGPAPSPIFTLLFSLGSIVHVTQRPRSFASNRFRGLSCRPVITCRPRHDSLASSSSTGLLGVLDQAPSSGTKRERAVRVTSNDRRQAAPLVSANHGCYEHCADDVMFLLSLILFASL